MRGDIMAKRDREFWESAKLNNQTYVGYYNRLMELSISMFDWQNLPEGIDARFLELTLFGKGAAIFFEDEALKSKPEATDGYVTLPTMNNGRWNIYNIPRYRTAYATNGYRKDLTEKNSVIIWNNMIHTNSMRDVEMFAKRLYELDRAIDVNAKAQKTPILITCEENQLLSMKNVYMKYDGNQPVIFGDNNLKPDSIKVLSTGAPYVADKLYQLKTQIWNEALTYLGISNTNITKKERMISDEVLRNQGGVIASRYSRLESRRQACEQINKMFNLDITCDYREDYREADDEVMFSGETGNGELDTLATDLRTR